MPREQVALACESCRTRNYSTTKNKRKHPDRLVHSKYCARCNRHTPHKETR